MLLIRMVNKKLIVSSRTKSASKTVITVVVAYYICWTPYNVHKILRSVCGFLQGCSAETTGTIQAFFRPIEPFLIVLAFSNSCLNPIIYAFTSDQFNDSLIKVFCGRRAQAQYRHNIASKREEGLHLKRNQPRSPEKYSACKSRSFVVFGNILSGFRPKNQTIFGSVFPFLFHSVPFRCVSFF